MYSDTTRPRRVGDSWVYKVQVLNNPKKVYQLKRIKSRLRVSFIGYSYNIKIL